MYRRAISIIFGSLAIVLLVAGLIYFARGEMSTTKFILIELSAIIALVNLPYIYSSSSTEKQN